MKVIEILLVEDNPGDIELTKVAFQDGRVLNNLHVVMDGQKAMDYLKRRAEYTDSVTPDIILLDLNIPKKSGIEVLKEIKNDDELKLIPVVILTTSAADVDVYNAYSNFANCYIRKPVDLKSFLEVAKKVEDFWLTIVKLP